MICQEGMELAHWDRARLQEEVLEDKLDREASTLDSEFIACAQNAEKEKHTQGVLCNFEKYHKCGI
jgi:hypothetical protein